MAAETSTGPLSEVGVSCCRDQGALEIALDTLQTKWIGFRHLFQFRHVQRLDRSCPVDPNVFVELVRQDRLKVVAGEFTLGR